MKPIIDDLELGGNAYYEGQDELYFSGSKDFRDGYRNAFFEDHKNASDESFEAHIDNIWRPQAQKTNVAALVITNEELYESLASYFSPEAMYEKAGAVLGSGERINTDELVFDPAWQQGAKANIASAEERVKTLEPGQVFRLEDLEGEVN